MLQYKFDLPQVTLINNDIKYYNLSIEYIMSICTFGLDQNLNLESFQLSLSVTFYKTNFWEPNEPFI